MVYAVCASAERFSEHPPGRAVVRCYRQDMGGELKDVTGFTMIPGRGVSASIDGSAVLAGNAKMLKEQAVALPAALSAQAAQQRSQGCTVIYVAIGGKAAGLIALSDTIREESADMVSQLAALQVQPVLLTGDHPNAADVGIAMGGVGSDIAVDAADIALVDDEVKELPHLIALSKRMMTTIKINMTFSMVLNFLAITLAIIGALGPVVGALVHNAGSVLVIINSALLLKWRKNVSQSFASTDAKSV